MLIFNYVASKKILIFNNFVLNTKIDLYCLNIFDKIEDKFRNQLRKYGRSFEQFKTKLTKTSYQN